MNSDKKLATKLLSILDTMGAVPKKGFNKHQQYHYMREVDVMEALKDQLIKNKIIMLTSSKFVDIQKKEGKDKTEFVTTVETTHTFLDTETGEQLPITSVGSGYDSSDKGASKAITAAFKYAVMKTFMISDEGADIESDGESKQTPVESRKSFNRPTAPVAVKLGNPTDGGGTNPTPVAAAPSPAPVVAPTLSAPPTSQPITTPKPSFGRRTNTASNIPAKAEPKFP